jgi:RNA polymerase II-associated factor 1
MDEIDIDDERHRREEAERRARRHREREKKEQQAAAAAQGLLAKSSSSGGGKGVPLPPASIKEQNISEKERKRREHAAKILGAQQSSQKQHQSSSRRGSKPPPPPPSSKKKSGKSDNLPTPVTTTTIPGGSSIFQSLFTERAEGFFIDLRFRNAPPRPPVGPTFVGYGLDGVLTEEWTQYKPYNAVETRYVYKVHNGEHLREVVSRLASSALDIEKCYLGEKKKQQNEDNDGTANNNNTTSDNQAVGTTATTATHAASHVTTNTTTTTEQVLSPDDEAILNWTGHMGDTATEALQRDRDKARASARETLARRVGFDRTNNKSSSSSSSAAAIMGGGGGGKTFKLKKSNHLKSRILDERIPNFMKKTTYLTNDYNSVHRFTSLASTQIQRARDVDTAVAETRERYAGLDIIERSFDEASSSKWSIILPPPSSSASSSVGVENNNNEQQQMMNKGNGRTHPTKKNVYPIWDLPLLPDIRTWGHTFTHVVLDNPPRSVGGDSTVLLKKNNKKRQLSQQSQGSCSSGADDDNGNTHSGGGGGGGGDDIQRLNSAIVADVARQEHNARMECTVWVPPHPSSSSSLVEDGITPPITPNKKSKIGGEKFVAIQKYDLDVVPLRDPNAPAVHYVWTIDPKCNYVGYHPIGSRVQLSMGRPPSAMIDQGSRRQGGGGRGRGTSNLENGCIIVRRDIDEDERKAFEIRTAEVDIELAEKHGRMDDDDDDQESEEGGKSQESTKSGEGRGRRKLVIERQESVGF